MQGFHEPTIKIEEPEKVEKPSETLEIEADFPLEGEEMPEEFRKKLEGENDPIVLENTIRLGDEELTLPILEGEKGELYDLDLGLYLEQVGFQHTKALEKETLDPYLKRLPEVADIIVEAISGTFKVGKVQNILLNLQDFEHLRPALYEHLNARTEANIAVLRGFKGEGGYGQVFEGDVVRLAELQDKLKDEIAGKSVAFKLMDFKEVAPEAYSVEHPNLMKVYHLEEGWGRKKDKVLLVMEGVPDAKELPIPDPDDPDKEKVSPAIFIEVVSRAMDGVGALNKNGIIYRDIKGPNILYTEEGGEVRVKVIDRDLEISTETLQEEIDNGVVKGTLKFMPPELIFDLEPSKQRILRLIRSGKFGPIKQRQDVVEQNAMAIMIGKEMDFEIGLSRIKEEALERGEDPVNAIERINVRLDATKIDTFAFGVMIKEYLEEYYKGSPNVPPDFDELVIDMTHPVSSKRITVKKARERLNQIKNQIL